ncbi:MAG: hypothetical protein HYX97_01065 [Chloroflexi bacterium]|nr:hypothetical protein [Chloroflexota bacterium]
MKWKAQIVGALALTLAVIAAACGGGEEATPTPRPTAVPQPTATTAPQPTARPQATATTAPQATATPRPQPTATTAPQATQPPSAPTGQLRVVLASLLEELLDPQNGSFGGGGLYMVPLYDFTLWATKDGNLAPGVATKWTLAPDGKSWTLDLRNDLKFHDGTSLTATDVAFSLQRTLKPDFRSSFHTQWLKKLKSVDVLSPTSVRVNANEPWLSFLADVSPIQAMEGGIIPKAYADRVGDKGFEDHPIGSGPFKFVSHQRGSSISFEAVTTKHPYRPTPQFKDLQIILAPEESTRVAMLKTGAGEIIEIGTDQATALKQGGFPILPIPDALNASYVIWGFRERVGGKLNPALPAALKDLDVRKALALAVDKQEVVDTMFGGAGAPAVMWPFASKTLGFDPAWKPVPFDLTQAKNLLATAGYPGGKGLSLNLASFTIGGAPWLPRLVEILGGYWSNLGATVQIQPYDFAAFQARYRPIPQAPEVVGAISGWRLAPPVDPSTLMNQMITLDGYLSFNLEQVDVFAELNNALDPNKREALFRQIANKMRDEYSNIGIANIAGTYAASKNIKGWDPVAGAYVAFNYETVAPVR